MVSDDYDDYYDDYDDYYDDDEEIYMKSQITSDKLYKTFIRKVPAWAWEYSDGTTDYMEGPCHGTVFGNYLNGSKEHPTRFHSIVFSGKDTEAYYKFLFGEKSPYLTELNNVVYNDRYFSVDVTPATCSNALIGLAIAARLPMEHAQMLDTFNRLVTEFKWKPVIAFVLCCKFHKIAYKTDDSISYSYTTLGHQPFDYINLSIIKNMETGERCLKYRMLLKQLHYGHITDYYTDERKIASEIFTDILEVVRIKRYSNEKIVKHHFERYHNLMAANRVKRVPEKSFTKFVENMEAVLKEYNINVR